MSFRDGDCESEVRWMLEGFVGKWETVKEGSLISF